MSTTVGSQPSSLHSPSLLRVLCVSGPCEPEGANQGISTSKYELRVMMLYAAIILNCLHCRFIINIICFFAGK